MTTKNVRRGGFALIATLVLMALVVIVVVAYLANTRSERSTSSTYANRARAKIMADSGLAAATKLLYDNTKYGNYITAMPAPLPSPAPHYTELYRPTDPSDPTHAAKADDYLQLGNAAGEVLVSRAAPTPAAAPIPQVDPRPTPETIPTPLPVGSAFALSTPTPVLGATNSFDFNQVVRVGTNDAGRLVDSDGRPAFGQWVRVRNSAGELIGRYAFFIEDESMKVNLNVAGNNTGAGGSNLRVSDLNLPATAPAPASQIQEIDPAAILPTTANRVAADTALTALGAANSRLSSRSSVSLLTDWGSAFPDYAHVATVLSRDDSTTARGWKRLDLNKVVADAQTAGTAQAKKDAAIAIANWIRDAWTGLTPVATLQDYQLYGDDWSRKQLAANIVDYIDTDSTPTDVGDAVPTGYTNPIPVIGLEKMPYLAGLHVVYEASNSTYPGPGAGTFSATIKVKLYLHFLNLYEGALDLADALGNTPLSRIEIKGIPIVQKNGNQVYNVSSQTMSVKLSNITPVNGTGTSITAGVDGTSTSGARTFQTDWLDTRTVSFTVSASESIAQSNPKLLADNISVKLIGNKTGNAADDYRVDETSIVTSSGPTQWCKSCTRGDFLEDSTGSTALRIASINYVAGYNGAIIIAATPGDPRYRGRLVSDRWNNDASRTDASGASNRLDSLIDKADINVRVYGFDWFDNSGDRPLAFIRDGAILNVGEIGNVAACEYPWRTVYLQYPERLANTTSAGPSTEIPLRRSKSVDYVLTDLFTTDSASPRAGAININSQQRYGSTQQHALAPVFLGERVASTGGAVSSGTQPGLTQTIVDRFCTASGNASYSPIFDRRVAAGPPPDNTPLRPFLQIGELASVVSRLVNTSPGGSATTGTTNRTTVSYSALRTTPATANEAPTNTNIHQDMQVEQQFREISNSITTRGNVFRILFVGQTIRDVNKDGNVDLPQDVSAEYLAEAFVERQGTFTSGAANPNAMTTSDSTYRILATRVITE